MEVIIAAIIGALGAILGSVITVFHEDILVSFSLKKSNRDLVGFWDVTWYEYDDDSSEKKITQEIIEIKRIRRNRIKILIENPKNVSYKIIGNIHNNNTITLEFHGNDLGVNGVASLIININRIQMYGVWLQPENNEFTIGRSIWTKITPHNNV